MAPRPHLLEVLFSFRVGGSEVVGLELAKQIAAQGVRVTCASLEGPTGPLVEECTRHGIEVADLRIPRTGILARNGFSAALCSRVRALNVDVMHLQHVLALNKLGLAGRVAGIPNIVVTEHAEAGLIESRSARLRLRAVWRLAHRYTVIHEGLRQYFVNAIGIPDSRIAVIPNGIDFSLWHRHDREQQRAALGLGDALTFAFVGRVAPVKNIPGLVRAFLNVCARAPRPIKLLIVGNGEDLAACQAIAAAHPAGQQVLFLGERMQVRPFLAAADAFVMNSISEGTPRAMLEAMALSLPCICPAVGGIPAMLEGRGWLTQPGDARSLEDALLQRATDADTARTFGERGYEFVKREYDSANILKDYMRVLGLESGSERASG